MRARQLIFTKTLQDAAASGSGTGQFVGNAETIQITAKWSAGSSLGVLSIEEADDDDYTGTWSVITTVTQSAASSEDVVHITGAVRAVRARLSTGVTGGTVTVVVRGYSG